MFFFLLHLSWLFVLSVFGWCHSGGGRRYCQKKISGKLCRVVVGGQQLPSFSHPLLERKERAKAEGRERRPRRRRRMKEMGKNLYYFAVLLLQVAKCNLEQSSKSRRLEVWSGLIKCGYLGSVPLAAHFSCKCGQGHDRCDLYYKRPHRFASSHYIVHSLPLCRRRLRRSPADRKLELLWYYCTIFFYTKNMVLTFSQLLISLPSGFQQIMRPSLLATLIILNSTSML